MPSPRTRVVVAAAFGPMFLLAAVVALGQLPPAQPHPGAPGVGAPGAGAPRQERADVMGRVVDVSGDGRTVTIAVSPRPPAGGPPPAAEAKPEEMKINLTDKTRALFFGVGDDEAVPAPGQMAMVWLEPGSKDQAARVRFMKRDGDQRPDVQGRVTSVSPDGRIITIETRDRDPQSGQEKVTGKADVKLAPYTQTQYFAVERGGARPTTDYLAVVWFEKGSKDTAARAHFMRPEK